MLPCSFFSTAPRMLVSSIVLTFEQPRADGKIVSFLTGRSASSYSWAENFWAAKGCSIVSTSDFRVVFHGGLTSFVQISLTPVPFQIPHS